jgi:hypothetical protein
MNYANDFVPFPVVQAFFESWGLIPSEEDLPEDMNPDVVEQGINVRCYEKLIKEAGTHLHSSKYRDYLVKFCQQQIDATDGSFYLAITSWSELEEAWEDYTFSLRK